MTGHRSTLRRRLALWILPAADRETVRAAASTVATFERMMSNGATGHTGSEAMLHKRQGIYEGVIRDLISGRAS